MTIDIIYLLLMVAAVIKGFTRGLVVAVFSIVAFIIGLAAALKLSAVVASWLGNSTNISTRWLPILSFLLVFIAVVLIIRTAAKFIENTIEWAFLGWVNKLGGIIVYVLAYTIIYSILLFYAEKIQLLSAGTISSSICFSYIQPIGPLIIDGLGTVIPWFKNMFVELQAFFERVSGNLKQ
jgi:membrane protein required for colicin V production